jgi:hypothetical protein
VELDGARDLAVPAGIPRRWSGVSLEERLDRSPGLGSDELTLGGGELQAVPFGRIVGRCNNDAAPCPGVILYGQQSRRGRHDPEIAHVPAPPFEPGADRFGQGGSRRTAVSAQQNDPSTAVRLGQVPAVRRAVPLRRFRIKTVAHDTADSRWRYDEIVGQTALLSGPDSLTSERGK